MPSTGVMNGNVIELHFGGTEFAHAEAHTISKSVAMIDITTKDSNGFEEVMPGLISTEISVNGLFAEDAGYGYTDLETISESGASVTVLETSTVTGDVTYSWTAYVSNLTKTAGKDDKVGFDCTLKPTGARTKGTVPA